MVREPAIDNPAAIFSEEIYFPNSCGDNTNIGGDRR
jgi:hypothetical protein